MVSSLWPPAGIAIAALLLWGRRLWPAVWLGAFVLNATSGVPLLASALIAGGDTAAAVAGAGLLAAVGFRPALERLRDVLALVALGVLASPVISATVGSSVLRWSGQSPAAGQPLLWLVWWSGDALGVLVVAPLLLAWLSRPMRLTLSRGRMVEAALVALTMAAALRVLLVSPLPYVYLVFPIGAWAAMRFGPRAAATTTFAVGLVAIWYTILGAGPFAAEDRLDNLFLLQAFLALLAVTELALAAMLRERQRAQSALAALSRKLLRAQELERVRVARELHDQVGQALVAVRLTLERVEAAPAAGRGTALAECAAALDRVLGQIRTLSFDLRPAVLDELDLPEAVRSYAERHARGSGLDLELKVVEPAAPVDRDVQVACFRILQEALANVAAHARAHRVAIELRGARQRLRLTVRDDGLGFVPAASGSAAQHLGLLSMQERAQAVGGAVRVHSRPGGGTTVTADLPVCAAASGARP